MDIEARAYGPDSSAEDIERLRSRIYLHKPDGCLIMWCQIPVETLFSQRIFFDVYEDIIRELIPGPYDTLVDLTNGNRPNPEIREGLKKGLEALPAQPRHVVLVTGSNFMANMAARFVLASVGIKSFSVHTHLDDALETYYRWLSQRSE